MFAKLLKHEWRASAALLSVLSVAALGVGVLAAVLLRVITSQTLYENGAMEMAALSLTLLLMFLLFALFGYAVACQIILLVRFYKNKFTDEGYLTFTLPVDCRQIFLASLLNMAAWIAISTLVVCLAIAMILLIGVGSYLPELSVITQELSAFEFYMDPVVLVLQLLVSLFYAPSLTMTCLTFGAVMAKKHKILMAFLAYYILSMAVSILTSAVMSVPLAVNPGFFVANYDILSFSQILVQAALGVGGYFLSTHLMRRKLNLP